MEEEEEEEEEEVPARLVALSSSSAGAKLLGVSRPPTWQQARARLQSVAKKQTPKSKNSPP